MLISGIQKFTMLDYPDKTACVIWTAGCNFRCGYCHNPEFVLPEKLKELKNAFIPKEAVFKFLETRKDKLDGVVISGGEPTIHRDLPELIREIKDMSFLVKLDSNGNNPEMLEKLFDEGILDFVAMDIKTCLSEYRSLVGELGDPEKIARSIEMIKSSGVDYEFRSTIIKETHDEQTLKEMAELVRGAKSYCLQQYRSGHTLSPAYASFTPYSEAEMNDISSRIFAPVVNTIEVRV